jgi:hypothetical protein
MDDSGIAAAGSEFRMCHRIQLGGISVVPSGKSGFGNGARLLRGYRSGCDEKECQD